MKTILRFSFCFLVCGCGLLYADSPPPIQAKYGPDATRLFLRHDYIQKHASPDFWALMPYYLPQLEDNVCSSATVAMVVNAIRSNQALTRSDELAMAKSVREKVKNSAWDELEKRKSEQGHCIVLDELGDIFKKALQAYGYEHAEVEITHVEDTSPASVKKFKQALQTNEKSAADFIVVNFIQGMLTGDPEGMVGHMAPIAAYDTKRAQALIFDPDRQYYEPYWTSEATLLKAMNTEDKYAHRMRGYLIVRAGH